MHKKNKHTGRQERYRESEREKWEWGRGYKRNPAKAELCSPGGKVHHKQPKDCSKWAGSQLELTVTTC
jgi:hypothetical protein